MPPREPQAKSRYTRPDASMSLLVDMMADSLDAGYAEATARRAVRGDTGLNKGAGARSLAVVGVALIAVIFTVSALNVHAAAPRAERERRELVERVHTRETSVDELQDDVKRLRDEVEAIQELSLPKAAKDRVLLLGMLSGAEPVEGAGLKVVIDDAEGTDGTDGTIDPRAAEAAANGRVLDRDLQRLVNGLWRAGAEAVAVNGQRLTPLSAIRAAGASILVNNRPLTPPYTILAIGDGKRMEVDFQVGDDGRKLHDDAERYGFRMSVRSQKKVKLPGSVGMTLRNAVVAGEAPVPGTPPPTVPPSQRKDDK